MKRKQAIIFVTNHPDQLLFYKNLARIWKARRSQEIVILLKIDHLYDPHVDVTPYKRSFDMVIEFPRIYKKNVLAVIREILIFRKQLRHVRKTFAQFEITSMFIIHSAWLPVNILLRALGNIPRIYRWVLMDTEKIRETRHDAQRTWYYSLFAFLCRLAGMPSYDVEAFCTPRGVFVDFRYKKCESLPGTLCRITNPVEHPAYQRGKEYILPLPLFSASSRSSSSALKNEVIVIFGDARVLKQFPEFIPHHEEALQKLGHFFTRLQRYYRDCDIYYKPHLADGNRVMPGITRSHYFFFPRGENTQTILESFHKRIRATYSFSSVSAIWSSFFGIPSYAFYRLIYNESGIKFSEGIFMQESLKSRLLFPISTPEEIGKIDGERTASKSITTRHLPNDYEAILKI